MSLEMEEMTLLKGSKDIQWKRLKLKKHKTSFKKWTEVLKLSDLFKRVWVEEMISSFYHCSGFRRLGLNEYFSLSDSSEHSKVFLSSLFWVICCWRSKKSPCETKVNLWICSMTRVLILKNKLSILGMRMKSWKTSRTCESSGVYCHLQQVETNLLLWSCGFSLSCVLHLSEFCVQHWPVQNQNQCRLTPVEMTQRSVLREAAHSAPSSSCWWGPEMMWCSATPSPALTFEVWKVVC